MHSAYYAYLLFNSPSPLNKNGVNTSRAGILSNFFFLIYLNHPKQGLTHTR